MKQFLIFIITICTLLACKNSDKKIAGAMTQEEKEKAIMDTANFTTIKWLDSTFTDLGTIKEGQIIDVAFRFKNTGNKNLIFSNVSASCGCTVPEKPERPYAPGEEGVIKAKFDSKGKPLGEVRKDIYANANTNPSSQNLTFRAEIIK